MHRYVDICKVNTGVRDTLFSLHANNICIKIDVYSRHKNNCQKMQPSHSVMNKRVLFSAAVVFVRSIVAF